MVKLDTIQKKNKLNDIYASDIKGNGGAHHLYAIVDKEGDSNLEHIVRFQNGARNEEGSIHGVLDVDLLEIVRHRLQCFQEGAFNSEYNQKALYHVEEALKWQNKRVEDRIKRNVLGRNEK